MDNKVLGKRGEDVAAEFLRARGLELRARNFRTPVGELDIVAEEAGTLVFVEVKTRRKLTKGLPSHSVHYHKQQKIIQTARWYLHQYNLEDASCRFDVVEVYALPNGEMRCHHIVDAFET
ncbi:MAG: YraN family protein [Selenomonadaceae bacterium]|nr:YraN family protein [Selenomonadaceae bacterium]